MPCHLITLRRVAPRYTSGLLGSARLMTNRLCRHLSYKYKQRPPSGGSTRKKRAHTSCRNYYISSSLVYVWVHTSFFPCSCDGSRRKKCVSPRREKCSDVRLIPQEFPNWILCVISHIRACGSGCSRDGDLKTREWRLSANDRLRGAPILINLFYLPHLHGNRSLSQRY